MESNIRESMIYGYMLEINSHDYENMTEEEIRKAKREEAKAKKETEAKKKEENNKDYLTGMSDKSVDYLDSYSDTADKIESTNESTILKISESSSIEISGKSDPKLITKIKKDFNKYRDDMLKDARDRYPDSNLKKSDIKISSMDFREVDKGWLNYIVDIGNEDGFYDCRINLKKKENELGYSDFTFND